MSLRGVACFFAFVGIFNGGQAVTPIAKVIQLLEEMKAKGVAEKNAEAVRFSEFSQWCQDQTRIKNEEIQAATEKIEMLSAKIEKAAALIRSLTDRIEELDEDVGRWEKDTKSATEVRNKEAADYAATSVDLGESLDALDGAILTLKKRSSNLAQAEAALLQVQSLKMVPASSKRALVAFLQQAQPAVEEMPDDRLFYEAPQAYGYEFQSGGVVDMLEKLKDQFGKQKYELDASELKGKHAYEQMVQQLQDNIENARHEIQKKTELRAQTQEKKAELEAEKAQTEADRAEDQKYLDDMTALCTQKSSDFESRQKLRSEELDAIAQAIDILSSDKVAGSGEKHLPQMMQVQATSMAQLRNGAQAMESLLQSKVAAFLADRAKSCDSRVLALAAQHVAADPFVKVKRMIKDLMSKLMQESTAEIEHKGWCDTELTANKQTRDQKTEAVEDLTAQKEDLTSTIAKLTQDIEDLTAAIKELDAAMAEATADRAQAKEKNEQTIADAKAAQVAVEQAMAILKDFYAKSAQATALVQARQTPAEDAPETFDAPYKGLLPEGGSVVDFLEVILTDFARLESETASAEAAEQDEFEKFMFDSRKDKALKENEKGHKEAARKDKETALAATEEELKLTQAQLDKAIAYYEKLKPTCVDSGITYEERVKRREEEIQSLQEALKILQGTDLS
mmetsp:Transcript_17334/g.49262  ORF Transcript_17334/g.49262 Transcript_17334/m.49262 type:complete len:681 (-) Transcript_17334:51-2093(-)